MHHDLAVIVRGGAQEKSKFYPMRRPPLFMAGIDSAMISKIARNISASGSNVYYMHVACNYVIFFDPEYDDGAIGPGSSAGSAPRARRALPALVLALGSP